MSKWNRTLALCLLLAGCPPAIGPTDGPLPTDPTSTDTPVPTDGDTDLPTQPAIESLRLPPSGSVENDRFATANVCGGCHSNHVSSDAMRDTLDREVAPLDLWESSMMANASRDPIWRAVVSAEIAATPGAADLIGQRCMACHAPMAWSETVLTGQSQPSLATLQETTPLGDLARDGVSCTLCHQIDPTGLGTEASWKGNYSIPATRTIYGPHDNPQATAMEDAGWFPVASSHLNDADLCATCHTLITEALNPDGTVSGGILVEQAPYMEMRNSMFATSSCQSCHLPARADDETAILTPIARNADGTDDPTLPNRPIGRHVFVGGNTLVPQLLRDHPDLLQPKASPEAFDATIAATRAQLSRRTAQLSASNVLRAGASLRFDLTINPLTGHKFPTGIPIRRAWLYVRVTNAAGDTVFLSGNFDARGRIVQDGALAPFEILGGPIEPHHDTLTDANQVQIYEAIMAGLDGEVTFLLLRGSGWSKDNRLLPNGWSTVNTYMPRIAPQGINADPDYTSGGDVLHVDIEVPATGALRIDARLYYQPLSHRFAQEIFAAQTPETMALQQLLATADTSPELISSTIVNVP